MEKKEENDLPHFVTSHDFHGDTEYVAWLQDMGESISREKLHQLGAELDFVDESVNGGFGNGRFERWQ